MPDPAKKKPSAPRKRKPRAGTPESPLSDASQAPDPMVSTDLVASSVVASVDAESVTVSTIDVSVESSGDGEGDFVHVEAEVLEVETIDVDGAIDLDVAPLDLEADLEGDGEAATIVPLAGGTAVLVRDALTRYLAEVNRYQRLTAEEEHALAMRYRLEGDHEALAQLITSNLRLVVAVAMNFRRAIANVLDLIQEGNIGLMEAIERFDPYKGTRLSTYATWWIRSRIVKYLLDNWRLVRVGTTNARRKLLYNLRQEKERMEARGIVPTPKLLAERLGTTPEDVIAVDQALGASDVSLDAPVGEDGKASHGDLIPHEMASPETQVAEKEFMDRLKAVLAEFGENLPPRERALLHERLLSDDPVTLQDIADREGVTREAVRQSEKRLTDRLRIFLQDRFPEAAQIHFG